MTFDSHIFRENKMYFELTFDSHIFRGNITYSLK